VVDADVAVLTVADKVVKAVPDVVLVPAVLVVSVVAHLVVPADLVVALAAEEDNPPVPLKGRRRPEKLHFSRSVL